MRGYTREVSSNTAETHIFIRCSGRFHLCTRRRTHCKRDRGARDATRHRSQLVQGWVCILLALGHGKSIEVKYRSPRRGRVRLSFFKLFQYPFPIAGALRDRPFLFSEGSFASVCCRSIKNFALSRKIVQGCNLSARAHTRRRFLFPVVRDVAYPRYARYVPRGDRANLCAERYNHACYRTRRH